MRYLALIAFLLVVALDANAQQSLQQLQSERTAAMAQIERIDKELNSLAGSKRTVAQQIKLVRARLDQRGEVLRSIDAQIVLLNDKAATQNSLDTLYVNHLTQLRAVYRTIIRSVYTARLNVYGGGILANVSTLKRYEHNRLLGQYVARKVAALSSEIKLKRGEVGTMLQQISGQKEQLDTLRVEQNEELQKIKIEQAKIEQLSSQLTQDEKRLSAEKSSKRQALDALQRQIERAIQIEIEESAKSKSGGDKGKTSDSDPVSKQFAAAKGRLPSPIVKAKIVDSYGLHNHPTQKGIKVDNKGVNLSAAKGTTVKTIAQGEVRKVFVVKGMGTSVLIRHGNFLSVYSNLENVRVTQGDKVGQGESIAEVSDDEILHFELWREKQTLNPAEWIKF